MLSSNVWFRHIYLHHIVKAIYIGVLFQEDELKLYRSSYRLRLTDTRWDEKNRLRQSHRLSSTVTDRDPGGGDISRDLGDTMIPPSNWRTNIFHNTNSKFNMKQWTEGTLFLVEDDGALSLQRSAE